MGAEASKQVSTMGAEVSKQVSTLGAEVSKQVERQKTISLQQKTLSELKQSSGSELPGSDYHPTDRKNWMAGLGPEKIHVNQIVWPGTHDSATNVLDIRVQEDRKVCHGILTSYSVDVVINDVKKFLSETLSEIIILEIRTEFGHEDPPEFDKYLESQLGELLIHQNDQLFGKRVIDLLPQRVICIWKPRNSPQPKAGGPLWGSGHLKDNWIDTDLPSTKFDSNMKYLKEQQPASSRKYFYRVENTVTPQADNPVMFVRPVTERIHGYARLFIAQCFLQGVADHLQVFSCDFIDGDFVDACVGVTFARIEGKV